MGGKLKYFIVSILIAAILAGIGVGIYMSWPAITGTINDSKYYTSEDIQSSYDKGYNDGINNETELNAQLEYYRTLVDEYYAQIVDYKNQNSELQKSNQSLTESVKSLTDIKLKNEKTIADLEKTVGNNNETISNLRTEISNKEEEISSLEDEKLSLQNQVSTLKDDVSDKEKIIADLELDLAKNKKEIEELKLEIEAYEHQITILKNDIVNKDKEIKSLQNQVESLSALVLQLQEVNRLNLETIKTLSSQIVTLNSQISELKNQIEDNSSNVSALEDKISKLQDTIKYYENYIKNLESDTQVVVTFEFNEVVYNIQVVAKNSRVSVVNPTDTDYVKFNYWTVDGEKIDLDNYTFSENKKVIADCTFFQKVTFMNDSQVAKEEFVERGKTTTAPSVSKEGFDFDGWTINGQDTVDVNDYEIDKDTTFTAKYTQLFTVTFMYESETKSTQSVRSGEYASNVDVDSTTYKIFNYWTVNGVRVDVSSYKILANTVFVADITYKFDVKFMVDDVQYKETQIITKNGYASVPSNPSKDKFEFDGWTINGQDVVNVATYPITQTTTFIAKFTRVYVVKFQALDQILSTQNVRADKTFTIPDVNLSGYNFEGWSVDGESIIDISQYKLLDDVTFIAVLTAKVGMFSEDGELLKSWQSLLDEDYFKLVDGTLSSNSSASQLIGKLIIDESVTSISSLRYCSGITELVVPNSVNSISSGAFSGLKNIVSLTIPFVGASKSVSSASESSLFLYVFDSTLSSFASSKDGFDEVSYYYGEPSFTKKTFYIPKTLTNVTITGGSIIYDYAFSKCEKLTSVNLKDNNELVEISDYAFSNCTNLCTVELPNSLNKIGNMCFYKTSLTDIILPDSLTSLALSSLFVDTSFYTNVYIDSINHWVGLDFSATDTGLMSNIPGYNLFIDSILLEDLIIPTEIVELPDLCFRDCFSIKKVILHDSFNILGDSCFFRCSNIVSVNLMNHIVNIGSACFYGCAKLSSIFLPISLQYCGDNAFYNMNSHFGIYCEFSENSVPSTFSSKWFIVSPNAGGKGELYYDYSYESYLEAVGLSDISLSNSISYLDEIIIPNKYYFKAC